MTPAADPRCPECGDDGTVLVGVGPIDQLSGQPYDLIAAPCPACSAGDREAAHRIGRTRVIEDALAENPEWPHQPPPVDTEDFLRDIDALSRAALAPAPSPCSEPVRNRTSSLRDDPGDVGGQALASPGTDLDAEQGSPLPRCRPVRDADNVAASPVVLGTGEAHSLQDTLRRERAA